jgi:glycosyltransferase involved in cell wall biosynthesis
VNAPLVSVVMPAYNCAAFVAQAIESALAQDYPSKEVIVVNDGSRDATLDVLRAFGDRIRIIDQANAGPPAARNAGLAAARGEYIAFLDADDVWVQGKLSAQVRHFEAHPEAAIVFTRWHVWPAEPDGTFVVPEDVVARRVGDEVDAEHSGWLYNRLLLDCELLTTTVMVRADVVRRIGAFDLRFWCGEDYDFWLRASRVGRITKLASVGALYRVVSGSASRQPRAINYEYEVVRTALERWGLVGPRGEQSAPRVIEDRLQALRIAHAYSHLHHGDPRLALQGFRDVLGREPTRLRLWVHAAHAALKAARAARQTV